MQVAVWLGKALSSIKDGSRRERTVEWAHLYGELTHGYTDPRNFRRYLITALDEAATTRRIHGDGIETNYSVEPVAGRRGGGAVLVIRRSPLLRRPANE